MTKTYSIADFSSETEADSLGQSLTLNDQGPDGTGTPGSTTARITSFSVGYASYGISSRSDICFVYNIPLTDPAQVGQQEGKVAQSSSYIDETGAFGLGSHSRRFLFTEDDSDPLNVQSTYYVYFNVAQTVRVTSEILYDGGDFYDFNCDADPDITLQFLAELSYWA